MAIFTRYDELKREIDALVTENDELKQLLLLLRENQELKSVLRNQYNENTLLPDYESSRIDSYDPLLNQELQESPTWDQARFAPQPTLRLKLRQPPDYAALQMPRPPPPPPPGAGGAGRFHPPLRLTLQLAAPLQDGAGRRNYPTVRFRPNAASPPGSTEDALPLNSAPLDYAALGSSTAAGSSTVPGGYCFECPIPRQHPQLPPSPPSDYYGFSSGGIESGAYAVGCSPLFLPTGGSPWGSQQLPEGGTDFAALIPQMDTSVAGCLVRWSPVPVVASAEPQPYVATAAYSWLPVFSPGSLQPGTTTTTPYAASPQTQFQPLVLQNAAASLPPAGAWCLSACPPTQPPSPQPSPATRHPPAPLAAPAQAPQEPQKQPDVGPEGSHGPSQQDSPAEKSEASEASEGSKSTADAKQASMERIVGEIAFQLDRRILSSIFPDRIRLYGFTVRNIPEKVMQQGRDPYFSLSAEQAAAIMERYEKIMCHLKPLGYDPEVHPRLTELIVNTFGILRERPELTGPEAASYNNLEFLQKAVHSVAPPGMLSSCLLLLSCLRQLSVDDGKPLFIW